MRAAALLLWASCLYTIARSLLCLLFTASPLRRALTLAVLLLAVRCAHRPREKTM